MLNRLMSVGFLISCMALPCSNTSASDTGLSLISAPDATPYTHVIDTRDLQDCETSSLPRGRCLPVDNFVDPTGKVISFHALRWLLGTVGLSGAENVLVIGDKADTVRTVGALLYLAGQKHVAVLEAPFTAALNAPGGAGRSLSREVIFTAPMRDVYLLTQLQDNSASQTNLARFALALSHGDRDARITFGLDQ